MNDNQMYPKEKMSRFMVVLWVLAVVAIATVIGLFFWGKSIHDGLSV